MSALTLLGALSAGALIGAILGFIGAGGAMLSVPILIYLFNFTPHHASTAALPIVFAAAAAGSITKFKSKDVLIKEATAIWGLGLVTNIGGAVISHHLSDTIILTGFALVLFLAGGSMLIKPIADNPEKRMSPAILLLVSLVIGSMTGIFGIGGGFLAIPVLVLFFHTPQNKAAGTSLVIIALNCFTAFIARFSTWHEISWAIPLAIALSAILVARFASRASSRVSQATLRKAFAFLLFAIALFTIFHAHG